MKTITRASSTGNTSGSRLPRRRPTGQSPSRAFPIIWGRRNSLDFSLPRCPVRYVRHLHPYAFSVTRVFPSGFCCPPRLFPGRSTSTSGILPCLCSASSLLTCLYHSRPFPTCQFNGRRPLAQRTVLRHVSRRSVGVFSSPLENSSTLFTLHSRHDKAMSGYCDPLFLK